MIIFTVDEEFQQIIDNIHSCRTLWCGSGACFGSQLYSSSYAVFHVTGRANLRTIDANRESLPCNLNHLGINAMRLSLYSELRLSCESSIRRVNAI